MINLLSDKCAAVLQVINVRTLKPLDRDTIVDSLRKTHRLVCVEEGWPQSGFGSEIIAVINEEAFDELDAPPERVTGAEVSSSDLCMQAALPGTCMGRLAPV